MGVLCDESYRLRNVPDSTLRLLLAVRFVLTAVYL